MMGWILGVSIAESCFGRRVACMAVQLQAVGCSATCAIGWSYSSVVTDKYTRTLPVTEFQITIHTHNLIVLFYLFSNNESKLIENNHTQKKYRQCNFLTYLYSQFVYYNLSPIFNMI